jgi:hypothetical protein
VDPNIAGARSIPLTIFDKTASSSVVGAIGGISVDITRAISINVGPLKSSTLSDLVY